MSNFEANLELPVEDLKERRRILEAELSKVVRELVTTGMKKELNEVLKDSPVQISKLSWDFYPESDDEGGTNWRTSDLSAYDQDDEYVDIEEIEILQKSNYSDDSWTSYLSDILYDFMYDYKDDLYNEDITEITL